MIFRYIHLSITIFFSCSNSFAQLSERPVQQKYTEADSFKVYKISDQMPIPPKPYHQYITEIKNACVQLRTGKVVWEFIIEKDGQVNTIKKVYPDSMLSPYDSCIVHQLENNSKWQPGLQKNQAVRILHVATF